MKKLNKGLRETPKSRVPSQEYLDNWEAIFNKKPPNGKNKSEGK